MTGRAALVAQSAGFALIGVVSAKRADDGTIACVQIPVTQQASLADVAKTLQRGAAAGGLVLSVAWCQWAASRDDADAVKAAAEDKLSQWRGEFSWFGVQPGVAQSAIIDAAAARGVRLFDEAERVQRIKDKVAAQARMITGGKV